MSQVNSPVLSNQSDPNSKSNYKCLCMGNISDWRSLVFIDPNVPETKGKCFLKEKLNLTGMEVSLNVLTPGEGIPFYHGHKENEELYIFINGKGQFQVDGDIFDVEEGSVIRVAPDGVRAYRNNSEKDLVFIVVQAKAGVLSGETISDGFGSPGPVDWQQDSPMKGTDT